jgi:hypothetical protein
MQGAAMMRLAASAPAGAQRPSKRCGAMEYVTVASALARPNSPIAGGSAVIGRLCGLDALGIVFAT